MKLQNAITEGEIDSRKLCHFGAFVLEMFQCFMGMDGDTRFRDYSVSTSTFIDLTSFRTRTNYLLFSEKTDFTALDLMLEGKSRDVADSRIAAISSTDIFERFEN